MLNYNSIAAEARKTVLDLIYKAQTSHIGSNFSIIDIMTVLFEKIDLDKDKFILSAGWKAAAFYYFLWRKGKITTKELESYCQPNSKWIGLSEPVHKDIPFAGGSMGMGLPAAIGFALAKKLKYESGTIYVLMSDGEFQCGTTWESFLIAAQLKLNNLIVICDNNGLQAMGKTSDILLLPFKELSTQRKLAGWHIKTINGHNYQQIERALTDETPLELDYSLYDMPWLIIANTIKGKGVSFMEGNNEWHYRAPEKTEYEQAMKELCQF